MAKLTTEQTMLRAKSHEKKGEVDQARLLYKNILDAFPNSKRAQQALTTLNEPKSVVSNKGTNPPQDANEARAGPFPCVWRNGDKTLRVDPKTT